MRSFSRFELGLVATLTMTVGTFPLTVFGVLAADLIAEFDVDRWQIGILVTATGFTAGLLSPLFGHITDSWGGVRATRSMFLIGIVTFTAIALAPNYLALAAAALACGVPHAWSNPSSNALVVDNVESGMRGVITGIKQSGVQVGTFLAGAALPLFSAWWGWRMAVLPFVAIPLIGLGGVIGRRSAGLAPLPPDHEDREPVPTAVRWVAVYGGLMGLSMSATFTFLPLFLQEIQDWTLEAAGWLIAAIGLMGIVSRVAWGSFSERTANHRVVLRVLAVLSLMGGILLAASAAASVQAWLLVLSAVLFAFGAVAWNSVGMLAVMEMSPPGGVGRGTGVVLFGFLVGFGAGAPIMGLSVDATGSYTVGWAMVAAFFAVAIFISGKTGARSTLAQL